MTEQKEYKKAREGQHVAVLNRYIKAGIHTQDGFDGAPNYDADQLMLSWELTDDWIDEEKTKPFWKTMFGKGNINDYDTDRAKKTTTFKAMFPTYDPSKKNAHTYLGKPCLLNIIHKEGKGKHEGKMYDNFQSVSAYPEILGELDYELSQPVVHFDFYAPTQGAWDQLKPWEQEYIKEAKNYPGSKLAKMLDDDEEQQDGDPDF